MKWKKYRFGIILIILFLCSKGIRFLTATETQMERVEIEKVVDGDTIDVKKGNGSVERIRLIGVNTPESVAPEKNRNTREGEKASVFTKEYLKEGRVVYLEYDIEKADKYGRTLAYIWLREDCNTSSYEEFLKYNYGAILLQETYCEAVCFPPNEKYKDWYERIEKRY